MMLISASCLWERDSVSAMLKHGKDGRQHQARIDTWVTFPNSQSDFFKPSPRH